MGGAVFLAAGFGKERERERREREARETRGCEPWALHAPIPLATLGGGGQVTMLDLHPELFRATTLDFHPN